MPSQQDMREFSYIIGWWKKSGLRKQYLLHICSIDRYIASVVPKIRQLPSTNHGPNTISKHTLDFFGYQMLHKLHGCCGWLCYEILEILCGFVAFLLFYGR